MLINRSMEVGVTLSKEEAVDGLVSFLSLIILTVHQTQSINAWE